MHQVSLLGSNLGIIPSWQFDKTNTINMNQSLVMPDGMTQLTVQPVGDYIAGVSDSGNGYNPPGSGILNGLGITMVGKPLAPYVSSVTNPLNGFGCYGCDTFNSPMWQNRKWVAFGAISAVVLGIGALMTAALR